MSKDVLHFLHSPPAWSRGTSVTGMAQTGHSALLALTTGEDTCPGTWRALWSDFSLGGTSTLYGVRFLLHFTLTDDIKSLNLFAMSRITSSCPQLDSHSHFLKFVITEYWLLFWGYGTVTHFCQAPNPSNPMGKTRHHTNFLKAQMILLPRHINTGWASRKKLCLENKNLL